jgi:hypothetical protein
LRDFWYETKKKAKRYVKEKRVSKLEEDDGFGGF